MSNIVKYYSIKSYEWLPETGDASKILVHYSIADDDQGVKNNKELSIVIRLSRNLIKDAHLNDETDKVKFIFAYLRQQIGNAIKSGTELPSEMLITSYDTDIPTNLEDLEFRIGKWDKVAIERKMGFLPSK